MNKKYAFSRIQTLQSPVSKNNLRTQSLFLQPWKVFCTNQYVTWQITIYNYVTQKWKKLEKQVFK